MLRPERMSRVSVTGSKRVMDDVIEAAHDLHLLHVTDYGNEWPGFAPGDPLQGADAAAQKLVTVRALESTLDVTDEDASPGAQLVEDDELDEQLDEVRSKVNEADDRHDEVRTELRRVEDRIDTMEPFVRLGIDLDLLRGYDSLAVEVGEGDPESVRTALADSDVDEFEVFHEDGVVAVAARTDAGTLQDALVSATFSALEVPDGDGDPESYLSELRTEQERLESRLSTVESELEELRHDYGGFLLAAEEHLTIQVDKLEAPLAFATTANAFIAEGWLPSEQYDAFETALHDAVGDHVEVSELERASYDEDGHVHDREDLTEGGGDGTRETGEITEATPAADGATADDEVVADGGTVTMGSDSPPVVSDNPGPVKPFEALTEVINRPKYTEFDPSVILFLTFPAFFGFMIGDVGYGVLYVLIGYWLVSGFDSDIVRSLGGVALWAGGFTILFGFLYGEIFGLHLIATYLWEGALGLSGAPMHKGLQPVDVAYAQAWLVVSIFAGIAHLFIGYVFDFAKTVRHGLGEAVTESGSWILMLFGLWAFIFSTIAAGMKPDFLYTVFGTEGATVPGTDGVTAESVDVAYSLGFTGLPEIVGWIGLAAFAVGLVLLAMGDLIEVVEFLNVLVNALSYTRLAAVLLAKAGMAFVVNLLFFGVYVTGHAPHQEWHFGLGGIPEVGTMYHGHEVTEVMFGGLFHSGIAGLLVGLLVLVIGHLLVLALGVTSAGLQAVRLEYVEFFGKFYEGGGTRYLPFGQEREYTAE